MNFERKLDFANFPNLKWLVICESPLYSDLFCFVLFPFFWLYNRIGTLLFYFRHLAHCAVYPSRVCKVWTDNCDSAQPTLPIFTWYSGIIRNVGFYSLYHKCWGPSDNLSSFCEECNYLEECVCMFRLRPSVQVFFVKFCTAWWWPYDGFETSRL